MALLSTISLEPRSSIFELVVAVHGSLAEEDLSLLCPVGWSALDDRIPTSFIPAWWAVLPVYRDVLRADSLSPASSSCSAARRSPRCSTLCSPAISSGAPQLKLSLHSLLLTLSFAAHWRQPATPLSPGSRPSSQPGSTSSRNPQRNDRARSRSRSGVRSLPLFPSTSGHPPTSLLSCQRRRDFDSVDRSRPKFDEPWASWDGTRGPRNKHSRNDNGDPFRSFRGLNLRSTRRSLTRRRRGVDHRSKVPC